eukprot:TRINITY_DN28882_c0_g1_i1.p1 TRINITY_DN28882_c0_g1~~TRINITY_DN28882_c0_g1_i1.p1  ORF type:complete len:1871 (+),score=353.17 TRINITY_DN28882_c0_g1_i1:773-6385(+)
MVKIQSWGDKKSDRERVEGSKGDRDRNDNGRVDKERGEVKGGKDRGDHSRGDREDRGERGDRDRIDVARGDRDRGDTGKLSRGNRERNDIGKGGYIDERDRGGRERGDTGKGDRDRDRADYSRAERDCGETSRSNRDGGGYGRGDRDRGDNTRGDRDRADGKGDRDRGDSGKGDYFPRDRDRDYAKGERERIDVGKGDRGRGDRDRGEYGKSDYGKSDRNNRDRNDSGKDKRDYDRDCGKGERDRGDHGKGERFERGERGGKTDYGKGTRERGDFSKGDRYDNDFKGDSKGDKSGDKGGKGGKGKVREERIVARSLRGRVVNFVWEKPSGYIKRFDDEKDAYFDFADVLGNEELKVNDLVEFDIVQGSDDRQYSARIKKLPKDTPISEKKTGLNFSTPVSAAKAGSLTGSSFGLGGKPTSALSGPLSLRPGGPGGVSLAPGGGAGGGEKKKNEFRPLAKEADGDGEGDDVDGVQWGRIIAVYNAFGFLKSMGSDGEKDDIFFRASDVVGMNSNEPGVEDSGMQILSATGRKSNGHKCFWLAKEDEVSYTMSKDHTGRPCAANIYKEKKGAWRCPRERKKGGEKKESFKDQVKRLFEMDADQVLQNASLFKEVLENPEFGFNPEYLYKIVGMLSSSELLDDTQSDRLYMLFLGSKNAQAVLRTAMIKQCQGAKHSGTFLEDCLRVFREIVLRSDTPADLRGQLPFEELVEAFEFHVREGAVATRHGLSEEVVQMLQTLSKHFPDVVKLGRVLGARAPKVQRSAAEEFSELMEADHYQDMPILPTSQEMLGQCAFEIQENMRTYEKCDDYIQNHFMLLREDYVEPLRSGIKLFMNGKHSPKDLHVYTGVKVVGLLSTWEGLVYRIELPKSQIRRISWDKSKQLMYGSLLCFSNDNFATFIWATVWRRDEHLISNEAQLDIRLPFESFDDRLSPGKTFSCIENVTIYFEAYRHVLIALQTMRPSDVPFQPTLLTQSPEPTPPAFVKAESDMFHFHNVFHGCQKADGPQAPKSFKILQDWPQELHASLDIDTSQLDAIQHALTHNMALIQGPPGTGKTWVGLKIVQALLENTKNTRRSPVLVVCYTNHALDQFLEGIFRFCERIARIGSRSKSEILGERNLKELVGSIHPSTQYFQARRALIERREALREQLAKVLSDINKNFVELADVQYLMTETQFRDFYDGFLDYLGADAKKMPEDPDDLDDDDWDRIMGKWLDTSSDFSKITSSMIPKETTYAINKQQVEIDANDEEEDDDAEIVHHDRHLDVEAQDETSQMRNGNKGEDKMKAGELLAELKTAWLPPWDAYMEKLKPELRSLSWREVDLWKLPISHRREIYRQWLLETHHESRELLPELARQLERNADHKAALERDRKLGVLHTMEVVGMTTTAVSKYQQLLKELRPEIVIVEEAAEVLEAHILTALHPKTQHVILIGDHQQLRPSTAVYRLSKHFHLDVSLFERLIKNKAPHITLEQQRRMHPKVSRLMKPLYPQLRDHPSVSEYPEVKGVNARCFFMTHSNYEDEEGESHSKQNTFEADFIGALCAHLVKSGYDESQITVLSPYLGQVRLIKSKLRKSAYTENMAVVAVDNFQGEENDVIVISLVRSNRTQTMGFLAVENRINVALTRARHGMFIVGNGGMLEKHSLWSKIMATLRSDDCFATRIPLIEYESGGIYDAKSSDDISVLLGDSSFETGDILHGSRQKVADRWAVLSKEDGKSPGKGKANRDGGRGKARGKDDWSEASNDPNRFSKRGGNGSGGGKGAASSGSGARGPTGARMPVGSTVTNGIASISRGGDLRPNLGQNSTTDEGTADVAGDAQEQEALPRHIDPPSKMEADSMHPECELVVKEKAEDEGPRTKVGKKKQKTNKVLMHWG